MSGEKNLAEPAIFRVVRVDDGRSFGLLLEKEAGSQSDPRRAYFHFKSGKHAGAATLPPPPHALHKTEHYPLKPTAELSRLVHEMAEYTRLAYQEANNRKPKPLAQYHPGKGYPDTVAEVFRNKSCPFASFIGDANTFKVQLLVYRNGKLEGRADGFRVCRPDELIFEEDYDYLRTVRQALEVDRTQKAQWFRDRGPVYADFQAPNPVRCDSPKDERQKGRVLRAPFFSEFRQAVFTHPITVVVGAPASGKSNLVRFLAHELFCEQQVPVYYSRSARGAVVAAALAREINSITGLIILEDAHRNTRAMQEVCERARTGDHRRLVITTQSTFLEYPSADHKPPQDYFVFGLGEEAVDWDDKAADRNLAAGITSFFEQHFGALPPAQRRDIEERTGSSLFLLGCALRGWLDDHGTGDADAWLAEHVQTRLHSLETGEDKLDPRVLLALAPLGKSDLPTAERFLTTTLGLRVDAINDLVRHNQVTRERVGDEWCYGLHGSELASAYWTYGKPYRANLPNEDEFVYRYAIADSPNGLEAILGRSWRSAHRLLKRVRLERRLAALIRSERSMEVIAEWISSYSPHRRRLRGVVRRALADRISEGDDWSGAAAVLLAVAPTRVRAVELLLKSLDGELLTKRLSETDDPVGACGFISVLARLQNGEEWLSVKLDHSALGRSLSRVDAMDMLHAITLLFADNPRLGRTIWTSVKKDNLERSVGHNANQYEEYGLAKSLARLAWYCDAETHSEIAAVLAGVQLRDLANNCAEALWERKERERISRMLPVAPSSLSDWWIGPCPPHLKY